MVAWNITVVESVVYNQTNLRGKTKKSWSIKPRHAPLWTPSRARCGPLHQTGSEGQIVYPRNFYRVLEIENCPRTTMLAERTGEREREREEKKVVSVQGWLIKVAFGSTAFRIFKRLAKGGGLEGGLWYTGLVKELTTHTAFTSACHLSSSHFPHVFPSLICPQVSHNSPTEPGCDWWMLGMATSYW